MPSNKLNYQREYIRKHYQNNKQYYKDKAKERDKRVIRFNYKFTDRYKMLKGCIDCGYKKHPQALHFDHVTGEKLMDVSVMVNRAFSLKKIKNEIRKCEVRCANCHAIVTAERRLSC